MTWDGVERRAHPRYKIPMALSFMEGHAGTCRCSQCSTVVYSETVPDDRIEGKTSLAYRVKK